MTIKRISDATAITPALGVEIPAAIDGDNTAYKITVAQLSGFAGAMYLSAAANPTDTTIAVSSLPSNTLADATWVVISPYTTSCEIRLITNIAGLALTVAALANAHAINSPVLVTPTPIFHAAYFGAGPGVAAATNATRLQLCIDAANGRKVLLASGTYDYDTDLEMPDGGLWMEGSGASDDGSPTILNYTGTGDGIKLVAAGFTTGHRKVVLKHFQLVGSVAAANGIDLTGNSKYGFILEDLRIDGFSQAGSYGLVLSDVYAGAVEHCTIIDCDSGVLTTRVCWAAITNTWIKGAIVLYGIKDEHTAGGLVFKDGIIDSTSQPVTQKGIYKTGAARLHIMGADTRFENLYQHFDVEAGLFIVGDGVSFASDTIRPVIDDGVTAWLGAIDGDLTDEWQMGLGTIWSSMRGRVAPPAITDQTSIANASPVIEVNATAPTDLEGFTGDAAREHDGFVLLRFMDANTTVQHDGTASGAFLLRDLFDWNPQAGDFLLLRKYRFEAGDTDTTWIEVGRYEASPKIVQVTGDAPIIAGDTGKHYHNNGAGAIFTLTLPNVTISVGAEYTFTRLNGAQAFRIDPFGTNRIRGATAGTGTAGQYMSMDTNLGTVKIQNVLGSTYWEIIHQDGAVSFA